LGELYRWVRFVQSWSMAEVMLLGILISISKLARMADLGTGIGFYGFVAFVFVMAAAATVLSDDCLWERMPVRPTSAAPAKLRRKRQRILRPEP